MREPEKYLAKYREMLAKAGAEGDAEKIRIERALIARLEKEVEDGKR